MEGIHPQRDAVSEMASRGFGNQADADSRHKTGTSDNPQTHDDEFIPVDGIVDPHGQDHEQSSDDTDIARVGDIWRPDGEMMDPHAEAVEDERFQSRYHTLEKPGQHPNFGGKTYVDGDAVPDELAGREKPLTAQRGGKDVKGTEKDPGNLGKVERHREHLGKGEHKAANKRKRNVGKGNV
ncbi:MAG: hypothetical protein UV82_C0002G0062 [Candidatus Magasanikbacteria bacterium GW2011_GWD2_43_18]|uniref:Uncharacterized protein n=1 Tax=Candidatus Magasanikbacteria bacterium GW2011_GWE2_42_7 TaxID=1619052 RepID=A0A0G1DM44_9BACT|nr:MAG: hypothetical protein UV18_C0003G0062 [Candidatus Magasanikbacteria bacterium GW2011_GWC2_42_27]KKS71916.1 MAG: hypothetical protein UV42_C0017G0020 [Candidatus Magasanikbacteria bacterium GW2011_GWE2_42_7]KKT05092.1 MAG: hypothetical protein UV82_C0002G0062 [Candidatus Magasanikbacteria bacterium GW2011_GWD2_43_18]KKT24325.1 MAG: hypothetical protein UW10_C0029G0004 [Candidatus Magasanikbacteria bacterium GW2011_GWA2_43_9]HBB38102.1 hypothetical protein [Candidatus Magasanikbacteria bac